MAAKTNRYCERLKVQVPRVEDFVGKPNVKLFDLLLVALLEHGEPLFDEEVAARLLSAGAWAPGGDMVVSLKKSWHGMAPVYRDPEGRLALDLSQGELQWRLRQLEIRRPNPVVTAMREEPLSVPDLPADDVPLTEQELSWAFQGRSLYSVSAQRLAAAVLDARDQPLEPAAIDAYLAGLTTARIPFRPPDVRKWTKHYVHQTDDGKLILDRSAPEVAGMRRAIRKLARPIQLREAEEQRRRQYREEYEKEMARKLDEARHIAAGMRRAVLRVVPEDGPAAAAALLDVNHRTIRTFIGKELDDLRRALENFDLVAGLSIRNGLHSIGITEQDRFQVIDLNPPQKTRQLNRQGRILRLTPEMLITSSTGISRPLGDPAKIAVYLASGDDGKLRRRLESDVKSLAAFYYYGSMHGYVRLRWGFLDELLPVGWSLQGDPFLPELVRQYQAAGQIVEIVYGTAPGWNDPWSRARRARIVKCDHHWIVVETDGEIRNLVLPEIQAIRPA